MHSTPLSPMSYITNGEDVLLFDVHSDPSLEDGFSSHESIGSKDGEVSMSSEDLSLLHTIFPKYPSTNTSRVPSSSYEDGESFSITMAHLGLLFHILAVDYDSLGVTYLKHFQSLSSMASCLIQDSSLKSTIFSPITTFQLFNMVL